MDMMKLVESLSEMPFNIYRLSVYDYGKVDTYSFQPCSNCCDSYSVAKAFVMTAAGILYDQGVLKLHLPIRHMLKDLFPSDYDPAWDLVTAEHIMTHRVGFEESFLDIDVENASEYTDNDYLSIILRKPLKYLPGSTYVYSDAAYYLLSRLISRLAGQNVDQFLREKLLTPMGFREVAWSCCPMGYPIGATGLYITTEDMLKLGILYLNNGVYLGKRYVSEEWVRLVISREYEFHAMTASGLIGKGGMFGQLVAFSPADQFAVSCHAYETGDTSRLVSCLDRFLKDRRNQQ